MLSCGRRWRQGSDGESEDTSATSEDRDDTLSPAEGDGADQYTIFRDKLTEMTAPVGGMMMLSLAAAPTHRRVPTHQSAAKGLSKTAAREQRMRQDVTKRLSLPMDLRLPKGFLMRQANKLSEPLTMRRRRASLCEIGFGKAESYTKLDKLGEGTYSTVYKGKSRLTESVVALKEIRLEHEEGAPCTAIREASLLRDLRHNNIVILHDIIHTDRMLTLVFEYMERDLKQYMEDCNNNLSLVNVRIFLFQILRGLAFCHKRKILHRDLKPQNLLVNAKGELKLADFGLARAKSIPTKTYSNEVVTLWYRPPEVLLGCTDYSSQIDIWGVGCIFFEMVCGRALFPGADAEDQLSLIFKFLGTPGEDKLPGVTSVKDYQRYKRTHSRPQPLGQSAPRFDEVAAELFSNFVLYDSRGRLAADVAMRHVYFDCLDPAIHSLSPDQSVFAVPGVVLQHDHVSRPKAASGAHHYGSRRRQSIF